MRWKFVEDELPKVSEPLLIWVQFAPLAGQTRRIERCVTGHRTGDEHWAINTRIKPEKIIAWMPVPKPPKAKYRKSGKNKSYRRKL